MGMEDSEASRSWYWMSDNIRGHTLFVALLLLVFLIFLLLSFIFFRFMCHQVKFPSFAPTEYDHDEISSSNFNTDHRIIDMNVIPAAPLGLDADTIKSLPVLIHRAGRGWASDQEDDDDRRNTSELAMSSSNKMRMRRRRSFGGESDCSICLGRFEDKEMVKVMPDCLHAFHSDCVDKWLSTRSTCPLCRASLDSSSTAAGSSTSLTA